MVQQESGRKDRVQRALSRVAAWRDAIPRGLRIATVVVLPPLAWLWSHHQDSSGNGYILAVAFTFFFAGRRMAIVVLAEGLPLLVLQIAMSGATLGVVVIRSIVVTISAAGMGGAIFALDRSRSQARADADWYRSMFETTAIGVLVADENRAFVAANQTLAEMLGYDSPAELLGLNGADMSYPGAEDTVAPLEARLQAGEIDKFTVERCYRRKDGSPLWIRVGVARIPNTTLCFSFFEDIHDSRLAQEELAEKTALLERAQQVGGVGSWSWYPREEREVFSEQTRRIFGLTEEEAATHDPELFYGVLHPEDKERIMNLTWHSFHTDTPSEVEYRIYRRSDGELRWLREQGVAELDEAGEPLRVLGAVTDITARKQAEEELREKSGLLERAQQVGGVGSWVWYPIEGRTVWSEQTRRILGFTPEEAATQDASLFFDSIHPEDRDWVESLASETFVTAAPAASEYRIVRRSDSEVRWVREQAIVEVYDDGQPSRVLGAIMDITERKRAEEDLQETAAELVRAQQFGRVGSWAWYPHENRNVWSQEARRIYGFSDEEADTGDPALFFDVVHPDERDEVLRKTWEAFEAGSSTTVEHRVIRSNGEVRWVRGQGDVEFDADGKPYRLVGVVIDITEQQAANQELERLAFTDPLTGLTNRTSFNRRLDLAVEQLERNGEGALAVLYIDLDDFKLVNDSFGHEAGDALLRETAARLRARTRAADLIGRQGGDEFLVLLSDVDAEGAELVARNLIDALQAPFAVLGADVHLSASIGISLFPLDAHSGEELLKHADIAMYSAKHAGRNNAQIYARTSDSAYAQISLTSSLHRALERDELELHYQPVFDLVTSEVISVEALIRWNHPKRGLVLPSDFIAAAERNGLIAPISNWVAFEACRQAAAWRAEGLDLPVAFNLPPALWQPGLMRNLLTTLEDLDLPADRIIVEITESALSEDLGRSEPLVAQLREAGLRLAIDDFGTGHSSLSRLAQMPVSTLKIDHSFIRDIPGSEAAATLVTSIIQLAQNLGIEPLAEGIESPAQREFLISRGCTVGQGFLLSKPLPADEAAALHRAAQRLSERRAA